MKKGACSFIIVALSLVFSSCDGNTITSTTSKDFTDVETVEQSLSKEEYFNKTLGGLLGQFAGFLSGYEFVWSGPDPYLAMPEDWFEFLNGPYAGNYEHYFPGDYATGDNIYDRHKYNEETKMYEVASDDDYHIDIFNQTIIDEFGTSSYAIKEAWKKYRVSDWGGGSDAMMLIGSYDTLAPFSGTIEGGNRYGWCTEAYIENETLGMNAPGMPNVATRLIDKFASNVGYFDSVIWAKFYGAIYSLCYFSDSIKDIMIEASKVLPKYSRPYDIYCECLRLYQEYPDDFAMAVKTLGNQRTPLYRIDNIQTDPNINGGFAILSWLYGNNDYMDSCMYSSIAGYDGDCTAAIVTGAMGIINGFKEGNEEYQKLNDLIYYDGEGVYFNDRDSGFPPFIRSDEYFTRIKIDDIIALYQKNFEKILLENGGRIEGDTYYIPTTDVYDDHSLLFENYDAEKRTVEGFVSNNANFLALSEGENVNSHSGWGYFSLENQNQGEVYHLYDNLVVGNYYRISTYVKTEGDFVGFLYASDDNVESSVSFANVASIINKEFIFQATSSTMKVGFKFAENAPSGAKIYFDDFFVETIDWQILADNKSNEYKLYSDRFNKSLIKPADIKEDEEIIVAIDYRQYGGSSIRATINRNSNLFGSVMLSNTSNNSTLGSGTLYIPYVFESDSDMLQLQFEGVRLSIGNIKLIKNTQFMFR